MKLAVYREALVLGLAELNNYRADMWFQLLSKIVNLAGLGVLWYWLLLGNPIDEIKAMIGYLLVANGVREFTDAFQLKFGGRLMDEIKEGSISAALVRPVSPYRLSYFIFFGTRGTNFLFGALLIVAGIVVFPPQSLVNGVYFGLIVVMTSVISYQLNVVAGFLAFWFTEASSMRSLLVHIARVLSGSMIPINYFPLWLRGAAMLSPFPVLAYLPAKILQKGLGGFEISLWAAGAWMLLFWLMERKMWNSGLKKYEAVGI